MAILSPSKSRRLRAQKSKTIEQFIVFPIQREWFALPIFSVKKVVPRSETHGDYHNSGAGLTVYEGKELLVLDIGHQVFGNTQTIDVAKTDTVESSQQPPEPGYLLIIRNRQEDLVGLPIASAPTVRRFPKSEIVPLPANYANRVNIQYVSGLIVQSDHQPILFLLNSDHFLPSQPLLPPTT
ncbi:MAG: chemotaxis protein CheW [Cyanobacteria bacterium P01_D01_bin.56]